MALKSFAFVLFITFCLLLYFLAGKFIPQKWIWLCSVLGAIFHNTGQILAAMVLMKTAVIVSYIPVLLFTGCIAGAFTGLCAQMLVARIDRKPPA